MSYTTPKYGLTAPDRETELRDLGDETKAMVQSIEAVLDTFDYNGADPDLFGARMVAAEAALTAQQAAHAALAARQPIGGQISITPSAANVATSGAITFPPGYFATAPLVVVTGRTNQPERIMLSVLSESTSGATVWLTRNNTTATTINWIAIPQ